MEIRNFFQCSETVAPIPCLDQVFVLEGDSKGSVYTNIDHDITLSIPEGAIPCNMKVHFEVAVALYGPFKFGDNRRPISPILWLCPQEGVALLKPIEIVLPHIFAKLTHDDISSLEIMLEKAHHQHYIVNQHGHKQFKFCPYKCETKFVCNSHGSYGAFQIGHCCFFCITAIHNQELTHELALEKGCCLTCVERPISPSRDVVYFCASFLLRSCLKVIS